MVVGRDDVAAARALMRSGKSMQQAARILGIIPSGYLDRALWTYIDQPDEALAPDAVRRPEPMF